MCNKTDAVIEDGVSDIDIASCIVGDLSSDIFSNIEKLNWRNKFEDEVAPPTGKDESGVMEKNDNQKASIQIVNESFCDQTSTRTEDDKLVCDKTEPKDLKTFEIADDNEQDNDKCDKSLLERRRVSLPEITTTPNVNAVKIR